MARFTPVPHPPGAAWLRRRALIASALAMATARVEAGGRLRIGDQRGGYKSLMAAAGVLDDTMDWSIFPAAAPLIEALNAGAIDIGGVGDAPFAFARAAGVPVRAVAATRSSGQSTAVVVGRGSSAADFVDLKGKRIATGKGSVGHFLVLAARDRAGLHPSDIGIVFLSPPDARAALASGAIDAWATWSQYVYLAVLEDGARIVLDGRGIMSGLSYEVARDDAIAAKAPAIDDFLRRLTVALRWGLANTEAYAAIWAQETRVPVEVARATLQARGFTPVRIEAGIIADQQRTMDLYAREGLLPGQPDAAGGFDTAFDAAAAP